MGHLVLHLLEFLSEGFLVVIGKSFHPVEESGKEGCGDEDDNRSSGVREYEVDQTCPLEEERCLDERAYLHVTTSFLAWSSVAFATNSDTRSGGRKTSSSVSLTHLG